MVIVIHFISFYMSLLYFVSKFCAIKKEVVNEKNLSRFNWIHLLSFTFLARTHLEPYSLHGILTFIYFPLITILLLEKETIASLSSFVLIIYKSIFRYDSQIQPFPVSFLLFTIGNIHKFKDTMTCPHCFFLDWNYVLQHLVTAKTSHCFVTYSIV